MNKQKIIFHSPTKYLLIFIKKLYIYIYRL